MREPVMQDKRSEHTLFCKEATYLIESVTERPIAEKMPNPKELTQVCKQMREIWEEALDCSGKIVEVVHRGEHEDHVQREGTAAANARALAEEGPAAGSQGTRH